MKIIKYILFVFLLNIFVISCIKDNNINEKPIEDDTSNSSYSIWEVDSNLYP